MRKSDDMEIGQQRVAEEGRRAGSSDAAAIRRFVGIDLAADPKRTGIAILGEGERLILERAQVGADDGELIAAVRVAERVGVDVPFGWPEPFIELMRAHAGVTQPAPASTGGEWRRRLAMRTTDLLVHRRTALTPLSVSTDRIAHPAFRWAGIEARLRHMGIDVARDGSGRVCEVYPAATLKCWSLPYRGYKGTANTRPRSELVAALVERLPRLDWNGHEEACAADDNALDAVLAALTAREVALGGCDGPPPDLRRIARQEGWIWLPSEDQYRQRTGHSVGTPRT